MFIQYYLFQPQLKHFHVLYSWVPGAHQSSPSAGIRGMRNYPCRTSVTATAGGAAGLGRDGAEPGLELSQSWAASPGPADTARAAGHGLTPSLLCRNSSPVSVSSTAALRENPSLLKQVKRHKKGCLFQYKCWWFNEKVALNNYVNLFLGLEKHLNPREGLLCVPGWDFATFGCKEHKWPCWEISVECCRAPFQSLHGSGCSQDIYLHPNFHSRSLNLNSH